MSGPRILLIIGGGSGIGRALCLYFASVGDTVISADISYDGISENPNGSGRIFNASLDVTQENSIAQLTAWIDAKFQKLDGLVYAAAPARTDRKPFPENLLVVQKELDILLVGALKMVAGNLPLLRQSSHPSVVLIGSHRTGDIPRRWADRSRAFQCGTSRVSH